MVKGLSFLFIFEPSALSLDDSQYCGEFLHHSGIRRYMVLLVIKTFWNYDPIYCQKITKYPDRQKD